METQLPAVNLLSMNQPSDGVMRTETFENIIQQLKQKNEYLTNILKEAKKKLSEVLDIVVSGASEGQTSRSAATRQIYRVVDIVMI
jgi:hypothetical protein